MILARDVNGVKIRSSLSEYLTSSTFGTSESEEEVEELSE